MGILSRFQSAWSRKMNFLEVLTDYPVGRMEYPARDFVALTQTGYKQNATVRACADKIARAVGSVPWKIQRRQGGKWIDVDEKDRQAKELYRLLEMPNIMQNQRLVKEQVTIHKLCGGFGCLVRLDPSQPLSSGRVYATNNKPSGIHILPPARFIQEMGAGGIVRYDYNGPYRRIIFENNVSATDPSGFSLCCPFYIPDPIDNTLACSPLVSVATDIDLVNEGKRANLNMLKNGMRPSGILYSTGGMSASNKDELRKMMATRYSGTTNTGKYPILEGNEIKWVEMSVSPKDADWIKGSNNSERVICLVMGVPPIMMNVTGDSTYANYEEANQAFWIETVDYHCWTLCEAITPWLCPLYGDDLRIAPNYEQTSAMQNAKLDTMDKLANVNFMTQNEKRVRVGLDEIDEEQLLNSAHEASETPEEEFEEHRGGRTESNEDDRNNPIKDGKE